MKGSRSGDGDLPAGVMTHGLGPESEGSRPGRAGLWVAVVVVLVVGGFAFSRGYGTGSVSSPTDLPVVVTPSTSSTTTSSATTTPVSVTAIEPSDPLGFDWMNEVVDVAGAADGTVHAVATAGVASLDGTGEWTLIDVEGLPGEMGQVDGWPGRYITQVAAGSDDSLWVAGFASSSEDDEQFGGIIDGWGGGRILWWVARNDGCDGGSCSWTVFTSSDVPELSGGLGDLVISGDGTLYASASGNLLLVFDGTEWESHNVPTGWSKPAGSPWSESLAVAPDSVVWAAVKERGLFAFDGTGFTRYTTEDGLPSNNIFQVAVASNGTIWAVTDRSFIRPAPGGIASFDGTNWITHTTDDGLLSSEALIATGADGTVWAVHSDNPPHGYSRFDGTGWANYPYDPPGGGFRRPAAVGPNGNLWTTTWEGLVSFDGTTQTVHPSPFAPPENGLVFVEVSNLVGFSGSQLSGVLLNRDSPTDGIAGFAVMVDSDPHSDTHVLGNVSNEWGDTGMWPWASGEANIPAGDYTLHLWVGKDYCCYGRWVPALTADLHGCELPITTTGKNQIIRVTDIPIVDEFGACGTS